MSSSRITRTSVPLLAWAAIGLFTGIIIAEDLSWRCATAGGSSPGTVASLALFVGGVFALGCLYACSRLDGSHALTGGPAALLVVTLLCVCVGISVGSVRWQGWHDTRITLGAGVPHGADLPGVVIRDPVEGRFGWTAIVRPLDAPGVRVRTMLPADAPPPRLGEVIALSGRIAPVDLDEEWSRRAHQRVEAGSVSIRAPTVVGWSRTPSGAAGPLRARVNELIAQVEGVGGDLLQGILLGDRTRLRNTLTEEDFRICGLSHLMAVSGTHLGIVSLVVARAVARARRGLRTRVVVVITAALAYVVLTGVQTSSLRAVGMGAIVGLAALSGRRGDSLAALSVAAGGMLVADPAVAFDIGFRLSVCAVGGLVAFGPLVTGWIRAAIGGGPVARALRPVGDMLALTLVAQAATAPVAIPVFGMFSLIAPLANVVALPLLTLSLGAGLGAGMVGLAIPGVATPLLTAAAVPLRVIAVTASRLASLPGAAPGVEVSAALLGAVASIGALAVWIAWPVPREGSRAPRRVAAVLCALMIIGAVGVPGLREKPLLTVLDVGQGDAVLVRDGGRTLLIDTGPDPGLLRSALTRAGVRGIDLLLYTHDHADHTGGTSGIVGVARVGRVFGPAVADPGAFAHLVPTLSRISPDSPGASPVHPLVTGDVLELGSTRLEVLWPRGPDPGLSTNDTSVVLHLTRGAFSAVLAGDAEGVVWDTLARDDALGGASVVLAPHHGSSNGMTADALDAWAPQAVLVSVGADNDFGHPSPEIMELLSSRGIPVARTDLLGDLEVDVDRAGNFRIHGQRRSVRQSACATIPYALGDNGLVAHAGRFDIPSRPGDHVHLRTRRPQNCLPDPRKRRPAARAGRGPPQKAALLGSRP